MFFRLLMEKILTSPSRDPEAPFPDGIDIVRALTSVACFRIIGFSLVFVSQSRVVLSQLQEITEVDLLVKETAATVPPWPVIPRFDLPVFESISRIWPSIVPLASRRPLGAIAILVSGEGAPPVGRKRMFFSNLNHRKTSIK